MATSTRARATGFVALCLLLSSLGASGALAGAASPQTAAPLAAAVIVIGNNSCGGTDACTDAVGPIGHDSCNGLEACRRATGNIGDNSCDGERSCGDSTGNIGDNSCNQEFACDFTGGNIGQGSCNGNHACIGTLVSVGNYSCNGTANCLESPTAVGDCVYNTVQPAACDPQPDARIRRIGKHNMVGDDIYNTDGTNQTLSDTLGDRAVRFVITIQNDSALPDSFTIGSSNGVFLIPLPPVNFYHGWHPIQDVTAAVMAGTYTTPTIAPGGVYRIRAVVRPLQINVNRLSAGIGLHFSWLVTATSVGNSTKSDAVRFAVDVSFT